MISVSDMARLSQGSRVLLSCTLTSLLGIGAALAQIPAAPTLDPAKEAAAIEAASTLDDNPADAQAVQQVCTACHSSSQFLSTPRSSSRWEELFGQMARLGANPSDEQVNQIVRYFQRNLMVVNVNTSPGEELGPTLQAGPEAVTAIVMRRAQKPFAGIADLAAIPGVDRAVLEKLGTRLQF